MRTIMKRACWNILELFYRTGNKWIHLRELSRQIALKEGALSRHLKEMEENKILASEKEGNLKKFRIKNAAELFSIFDREKFNSIQQIRRNSVKFYINQLKEKPVFIILFGSTAKGAARENSDIDLLSVFNKKTDTKQERNYAESQTGIKINEFQMSCRDFAEEFRLKTDNVVQSAIETGFPVFNQLYYREEEEDGFENFQNAFGKSEFARRKN